MKAEYGGIFGIKKPSGPTSHDIVDRLREITGINKIGHAGTLDPIAEGVLVVAIGRKFTKRISKYQNSEKDYRAVIRLNKTSDTDDRAGEIKPVKIEKTPDIEKIKDKLNEFIGTIQQTPPIYSAVKINGIPSYKLARRGKTPNLSPRKVVIKEIIITDYQFPDLSLFITSGPGVYVRSIARDLGKKLKTGGILFELIRIRVGKFTLKNSYSLREFKSIRPHMN